MKKKGFTLIELLAVIVILAVIALIAVPTILNVIEKSRKGSAEQSALGYIDAIEKQVAINELDETKTNIEDGIYDVPLDSTYGITIKGEAPKEGWIEIEKGIIVDYSLLIGKYVVSFERIKEKIQVEKNGTIKESGNNKIYGIKRSLTTSSSEWERIGDSVGLVANAQVGTTPVQNDFDNIYPWSDIISYNYNTDTKQITAYYGDEKFKFDGSNGEVLTSIPSFYYKREQDSEYEYIYISRTKKEGYTKSNKFSVGRYAMSGDATKVHSRSGYEPLTGKTISEFRTYARSLGREFSQLDYHYFILQLLYLVEYADYNSQAKLGPGYTNASHKKPINSGGCDELGMKSGSVDGTDNTSIIYRGIEDIFGNVCQFVDGINIKDRQAYICYDSSKYESDKFDGCYESLGYINVSKNGYITKLGYDQKNQIVALPIETTGGSASTYISDYYNQSSGNKVILVDGRYSRGPSGGLWYFQFSMASSFTGDGDSARLIKTS